MLNKLIERLLAIAGRDITLRDGETLFHQRDCVTGLYIIKQGVVELTRHHENGAALILQSATSNNILAEASIYTSNYHCSAIARGQTSVHKIPKNTILDCLSKDTNLSHLWAMHLASQVQQARFRCEILSRNTVAEKLDGWLTWKGQDLPPKGRWKTIAAEIGVSPEALYREIAKRS